MYAKPTPGDVLHDMMRDGTNINFSVSCKGTKYNATMQHRDNYVRPTPPSNNGESSNSSTPALPSDTAPASDSSASALPTDTSPASDSSTPPVLPSDASPASDSATPRALPADTTLALESDSESNYSESLIFSSPNSPGSEISEIEAGMVALPTRPQLRRGRPWPVTHEPKRARTF